MATITKRDLVVAVSNKTGLTQDKVFGVIQETLNQITENLASGDQIALRNFGAFEVRKAKSKVGRNPKAPQDTVVIPARAVVKFKPGKEMKEKVAQLLPNL